MDGTNAANLDTEKLKSHGRASLAHGPGSAFVLPITLPQGPQERRRDVRYGSQASAKSCNRASGRRVPGINPSPVGTEEFGLRLTEWLELLLSAVRFNANEELGEYDEHDLLQAAILQVLDAHQRGMLPRLDAQKALFGYVLTAARNIRCSKGRRIQHETLEPLLEPLGGGPGPDAEEAAQDWCRDALRRARTGLSWHQNATILLRSHLGCSFEVIAKVLRQPTAAAAQRYHSRSLAQLRDLVGRIEER